MIQFNLLPDVKLEYIKSRRLKRMMTVISTLVASVSVAIFALLFIIVNVGQHQHLSHLNNDIKQSSKKLEDISDLDKILTVQNQLESLPQLYAKRPAATRLTKYIEQITPTGASIASLNVNFEDQTINFTGAADSITTINKFVDTLKFTDYKAGDKQVKAFSGVVLSSFGRDTKGASYNITAKFDPAIFDGTNDVILIVPKVTTTRSETEKPSDQIFQPLSNPEIKR